MKDKLSLDVNSAERMEDGESSKNGSERKKGIDPFSAQNLPKLLFCFFGLQVSYIVWGIVQEQLMTQEYGGKKFESASFCVFGNRFFALFIALGIVLYQKQFSKDTVVVEDKVSAFDSKKNQNISTPFYAYAACSASNSLSSFAQYEALKYISFPMQVLSKSCKIIPVMLAGILLNKQSYPKAEYIDAVIITIGVTMFTVSERHSESHTSEHEDPFWGVILLAIYLACDSFTSQWQDRVYKAYNINHYQMMLGVNVWSMFFTGCSLIRNNEGLKSFMFIMGDTKALAHMTILSITSATGQLFIYYTVKEFGPVIFTIIMTTRQLFSLFFSCLIFAHPMQLSGWFGAFFVFVVLFNRIKRGKSQQFWAIKC